MGKFSKAFEKSKEVFEKHLEAFFLELDSKSLDEPVYSAVKYSVLNGGKRVRAILAMEGARFCGIDINYKKVLDFALAIELIHAYSLVHDDLPSLDNDVLRRGKPSTHVQFGENIAILAGDALLNLSMEVLLKNADNQKFINAMNYVYQNTGIAGMIGGQCVDVLNNQIDDLYKIISLYEKKTGALFSSALVGSAIAFGASEDEISDLKVYASNLGLLFQFVDDLLDVTSSSDVFGKTINKDAQQEKVTSIALLGKDGLSEYIRNFSGSAKAAIEKYDNKNDMLLLLVDYFEQRSH